MILVVQELVVASVKGSQNSGIMADRGLYYSLRMPLLWARLNEYK